MRGYFITQYQMEGIHAGIQALHGLSALFNATPIFSYEQQRVLVEWNKKHFTSILLNGGYQSNLISIYETLSLYAEDAGWPVAKFHESIEATNGLLTCVALVIPEDRSIPEMHAELSAATWADPNRDRARLAILSALKDLKLAR